MTTAQTITRLKPLRTDVSKHYRRVLDVLATGAPESRCQPAVTAWQDTVREYLDLLYRITTPKLDARLDDIEDRIETLTRRLDKGFGLAEPESTVESWKLEQHFESLLSELEVCCDLTAGYDATRNWLLGKDARLRFTVRTYPRIGATQEAVTA